MIPWCWLVIKTKQHGGKHNLYYCMTYNINTRTAYGIFCCKYNKSWQICIHERVASWQKFRFHKRLTSWKKSKPHDVVKLLLFRKSQKSNNKYRNVVSGGEIIKMYGIMGADSIYKCHLTHCKNTTFDRLMSIYIYPYNSWPQCIDIRT